MASLNKVCLIGHLTADPVTRYAAAGQPVTSFSIATNHYSTGSDGQSKEFTDFHNCAAWNYGRRDLAQFVGDHIRKGALVYVEGRLQTRSWEGEDGVKRRATEVVCFDVQLLESKDREPAGVATTDQSESNVDPEGIPF